MLEKDHPEIPLKTQADLLGVSYSSLFYEPVPPSVRELAIKRRIDEIYTACPFYGSRKIAVQLRPEFGVSRPTVQAYMRDQGSHFTSPKYLERLQREEIQISMDGRGRAMDNIFTERLWRTLKYEEVYLHEYTSPKEADRQLANYIRFYNLERPHQALDYLTPAQVYAVDSRVQLVLHSTLTNQTTLK